MKTELKPTPRLIISKNKKPRFGQPHYTGKITLPESLEAGEYTVRLFLQQPFEKPEENFMCGNIRKAVKEPSDL